MRRSGCLFVGQLAWPFFRRFQLGKVLETNWHTKSSESAARIRDVFAHFPVHPVVKLFSEFTAFSLLWCFVDSGAVCGELISARQEGRLRALHRRNGKTIGAGS